LRSDQIQLRDPFVVTVFAEGRYYLFGSTDTNIWGPGYGFDCYTSQDLQEWEGPRPVFRPHPDFWSEENFWAPEVYAYRGRYYLLATFKVKATGRRGTGVLVADAIDGPYQPVSEGPVTPPHWDALDGSLYVDDEGSPWMIFCHEWTEIQDGTVCLTQLEPDLSRAVGEVSVLFAGSQGPWLTPKSNRRFPVGEAFVTDGPYLHRSESGTLVMLWSSFRHERYALGAATSPSGDIRGPWVHQSQPLYADDGGHGMIFRGLDGQFRLTLHQPNQTPWERPRFFRFIEEWGAHGEFLCRIDPLQG